MLEILADALKDGLMVLPFVFLIYVLMELVENARNKEKIESALSGSGAPIFAAVTGVVPECGFSVMCSKLFDNGLIGIGTLIAAFIATSDEGIVVLLGEARIEKVVSFLVLKLSYAALVGMILNLIFKKYRHNHVCPPKNECVECGSRGENLTEVIFLHPFYHAVKTFFWILGVTIVINSAVYLIGEEVIAAFISRGYYLQPVIAAGVGLIPNCASSIIIAQTYCEGVLSFGGLLAGLSANAGMGLIVLFRSKKDLRRNLTVIGSLFLSSVVFGYIGFLTGI